MQDSETLCGQRAVRTRRIFRGCENIPLCLRQTQAPGGPRAARGSGISNGNLLPEAEHGRPRLRSLSERNPVRISGFDSILLFREVSADGGEISGRHRCLHEISETLSRRSARQGGSSRLPGSHKSKIGQENPLSGKSGKTVQFQTGRLRADVPRQRTEYHLFHFLQRKSDRHQQVGNYRNKKIRHLFLQKG